MTRGGMRRAGRDPWWDGARLPGSGSRKHVTLFVLAKNVLAKKSHSVALRLPSALTLGLLPPSTAAAELLPRAAFSSRVGDLGGVHRSMNTAPVGTLLIAERCVIQYKLFSQ